jgi:hypothetical protein
MFDLTDSWRLSQMADWRQEFGIEYFEGLG